MSDIGYYTEKGFFNFRFLAEAIPPPQAVRIARAILDQGLDINWHAFIRVDKNFTPGIFEILKKCGFSCTVGMESASTRVLEPDTSQGPEMNGGRLTSLPFEDPKGMTEAQISAVFQAYKRLNRSVEQKKPGDGTGIDTLFRDQGDGPHRQWNEMASLQ